MAFHTWFGESVSDAIRTPTQDCITLPHCTCKCKHESISFWGTSCPQTKWDTTKRIRMNLMSVVHMETVSGHQSCSSTLLHIMHKACRCFVGTEEEKDETDGGLLLRTRRYDWWDRTVKPTVAGNVAQVGNLTLLQWWVRWEHWKCANMHSHKHWSSL